MDDEAPVQWLVVRTCKGIDPQVDMILVMTVEPGLYYPGLGGCRWEDVVWVMDVLCGATGGGSSGGGTILIGVALHRSQW